MSNFHGQDMCLFVCDVQISFVNSSPYWTTNLPSCDKRCDFKSKPIQPPLPPIVDPQVGSATKLPWPFPVLANIHLSQHIPQTSFSNFQWSNRVQASSLLICTFQYSPLQLLEISFVFHRCSLRAIPASGVYWATIFRYWELQTTIISVLPRNRNISN